MLEKIIMHRRSQVKQRNLKRHNSELRNSLNAILKVISIIIVPLGAMLFYKQYMIVGDTLKDSVVNMVAAVLGMIPEGLVLLTSVALTLFYGSCYKEDTCAGALLY